MQSADYTDLVIWSYPWSADGTEHAFELLYFVTDMSEAKKIHSTFTDAQYHVFQMRTAARPLAFRRDNACRPCPREMP